MAIDPKKEQSITPLGFHNYRGNHEQKFGIKIDDRRRHVYVIGKTGVGKTTLLENMAVADIRSGKGVCIIDPHGEFAEKLLDFIPEERLDDVIYFDPSDMEHPIAFNPMEQVGTEFRHLVASGLMGVFKKIWADAWSARMQYILNNTLLSLLEFPDATLLGILKMFSNPKYRAKIVENLTDPVIKAFWKDEFSKYSQRFETEALAAIQNKVGQFVSNPLVRNILGQSRSTLNMREIMDSGKIFIANLSKGKIGEDNSSLLGAMIITRLQLAAMSRVDIREENKRRDFFMYVDEFQNFATESFASILSEARKYRLSLVLAHQYIGQLVSDQSTKVRDAVFGNVGTIVTFRVGATDAEFLENEFMPEFTQQDLVNLSKANIYIKLMIDGVASRPFSAETLPPQVPPLQSYRDIIIKNSQERYGTPRKIVDDKIAAEWSNENDDVIDEKIGRRNEQRLSETLRPDSRNRDYDRGGDRGPRNNNSGPYTRPGPGSSPGAQPYNNSNRNAAYQPSYRDRPPLRPAASPAPAPMSARASAPPSPMNAAPRPAPTRPVDDDEYEPMDLANNGAAPSSSAPSIPPPSGPRAASTSPTPAPPVSNPSPVSPAGGMQVAREHRLQSPRQAPKHFPKQNVDIAELRRAISESLKKQSGAEQKPKESAKTDTPPDGSPDPTSGQKSAE